MDSVNNGADIFMLLKSCRCGELIPLKDRYCKECAKKLKKDYKEVKSHRKDYEQNKLYSSKKWIQIRDRVRQRDRKLCLMCLDQNKIEPIDVVHHIVPYKEDESLTYNMNNLICLCNKHHNIVHDLYFDPNEKVKTQDYLRELINVYKFK